MRWCPSTVGVIVAEPAGAALHELAAAGTLELVAGVLVLVGLVVVVVVVEDGEPPQAARRSVPVVAAINAGARRRGQLRRRSRLRSWESGIWVVLRVCLFGVL